LGRKKESDLDQAELSADPPRDLSRKAWIELLENILAELLVEPRSRTVVREHAYPILTERLHHPMTREEFGVRLNKPQFERLDQIEEFLEDELGINSLPPPPDL